MYCVYCVDVLRGIDHSKSESSVPTEINDQWLNHKSQYSNVDHFPLSNINQNNRAIFSLKNNTDSLKLKNTTHFERNKFYCKRHNETSLFTCENNQYMGTGMKCHSTVCRTCI